MRFCKLINLLIDLFPLKVWQDFLIRMHVLKCPYCQSRLASVEEIQALWIKDPQCENMKVPLQDYSVRSGRSKHPNIHPAFRWKWALGVTGLIAAIILGVQIFHNPQVTQETALDNIMDGFRIDSIKIGNQPANYILFQPQNSPMIIVWAEKVKEEKSHEHQN